VSVANQKQQHTLTKEITKGKMVTPCTDHKMKATNFIPKRTSLAL